MRSTERTCTLLLSIMLFYNKLTCVFLTVFFCGTRSTWIQGNPEPFDELVNQFNPKKFVAEGVPYTADLRLWILALSHVVSRLERRHTALVEAIVNMPWTTMDDATVKSYTTFIGMLLSARPEYLSLVLTKIASGFTHRA